MMFKGFDLPLIAQKQVDGYFEIVNARGVFFACDLTESTAMSIVEAVNSHDSKDEAIQLLLDRLEPFTDMAKEVKGKDYVMTNNPQRHYEKWKEGDWEVYDLDICLQVAQRLVTELRVKYPKGGVLDNQENFSKAAADVVGMNDDIAVEDSPTKEE